MPLGGPLPDPSLRALGVRCWAGVPPLPSPPLCPLALGARNRPGGSLSSVALLAVSSSSRVLLGVSSPLSGIGVPPMDGAVLALTGPPTGAARAAPMRCAGKYPALFGSPPRLAQSLPTGPPTAAAKAAPVGCAVGRPVPPVCCSVPASASSSFNLPRPVAPLRLRHWSAAPSEVGGGWVFVSSPPPASVLPPLGSGRCGGSQGFISLGASAFSGVRVIP